MAIVVVTFAVFAQVATFDFINLDDPAYIYGSPHLREGLSLQSVQWALTEYKPVYWHPLTWISYLVDVEIFGFGPRGHHITNLLLHALTSAAVFFLLLIATGRRGIAIMIASLFATHPLHVESFAWVAERKDVLSGLFFVVSLLAYVMYARVQTAVSSRPPAVGPPPLPTAEGRQPRAHKIWLTTSWLLFVASCASKPMAVTLPFDLLLLDWWPLRRPIAVREKLPFF